MNSENPFILDEKMTTDEVQMVTKALEEKGKVKRMMKCSESLLKFNENENKCLLFLRFSSISIDEGNQTILCEF
jgi:hypothetical protein